MRGAQLALSFNARSQSCTSPHPLPRPPRLRSRLRGRQPPRLHVLPPQLLVALVGVGRHGRDGHLRHQLVLEVPGRGVGRPRGARLPHRRRSAQRLRWEGASSQGGEGTLTEEVRPTPPRLSARHLTAEGHRASRRPEARLRLGRPKQPRAPAPRGWTRPSRQTRTCRRRTRAAAPGPRRDCGGTRAGGIAGRDAPAWSGPPGLHRTPLPGESARRLWLPEASRCGSESTRAESGLCLCGERRRRGAAAEGAEAVGRESWPCCLSLARARSRTAHLPTPNALCV